MKLKRQPEDFQVEELTEFKPDGGLFALYTLTKRSMGTPEALQAVAERWRIQRQFISYGGLKDKHAQTTQFVTIDRGPRRDMKQSSFDFVYVGQASRAFGPKDIAGNRFRIVMRDLWPDALGRAKVALAEAGRDRLPNYFDDQRFGSLGESGDFVGRAWCEENYERALWLAIAEPNEHDRPRDRKEKETLRRMWGKFPEAKAALEKSNRRSLVSFLVDRPGDYRGAVARLNQDMRSLYLSAYQSYLWNRLLGGFIREICRPAQHVPVEMKSGTMTFYRALDEAQRAALGTLEIPLPSSRTKIEDAALRERVNRVLGEVGTNLETLKIRHPRENFFSKGMRAATFPVGGVESDDAPDELYARKRKLIMKFDLPRGAYATIVVKRVTVAADPQLERRRRS